MKKVIGIDVDGPLVDTLTDFLRFTRFNICDKDNYQIFTENLNKSNDPYKALKESLIQKYNEETIDRLISYYWNSLDYFVFQPDEDVLISLEKFKSAGYYILIITRSLQNRDNKINWLLHYFGTFIDDIYLVLNNKSYICVDYFIDDGIDFINGMKKINPDTKTFLFKTILNQYINDRKVYSWYEIRKEILKED